MAKSKEIDMLEQWRTNLASFVKGLDKTRIHVIDFGIDYKTRVVSSGRKELFYRWKTTTGTYYIQTDGFKWFDIYLREHLKSLSTISTHMLCRVTKLQGHPVSLLLDDYFYYERDYLSKDYLQNINTYEMMLIEGEDVIPFDRKCYFKEFIDLGGIIQHRQCFSIVPDISRVCYGSYIMEAEKTTNYSDSAATEAEKGVLWDETFISFLQQYVVVPVAARRPDFMGTTILYDEQEELEWGHKSIVVMYEFVDEGMYLYLIKEETVFGAYLEREKGGNCFVEFVEAVRQEAEIIGGLIEPWSWGIGMEECSPGK